MKVSVRNAKDKMLVYLLKLAADSFAKNLMSPQLTKHLSIKIVVRETLDAGGFCDYEIDPAGNPREFNIELLRTRKKINMFKVLAHEMVHVKQHAKGEAKDKIKKDKYITLWFGEKYDDDTSYWDQPWEIEAYGLENSLVAKFLVEHDQFKNLRQKHEDWFAEESIKE
jgi:hypothetical protein